MCVCVCVCVCACGLLIAFASACVGSFVRFLWGSLLSFIFFCEFVCMYKLKLCVCLCVFVCV